jgi:hypothetical protein
VRCEIEVVPPGGGKTDYTLLLDQTDHAPAVGEYLLINDERNTSALAAFKVLYVVTTARYVSDGQATQASLVVTAEVVNHPHQGESHKRLVEKYRKAAEESGSKKPEDFPGQGP